MENKNVEKLVKYDFKQYHWKEYVAGAKSIANAICPGAWLAKKASKVKAVPDAVDLMCYYKISGCFGVDCDSEDHIRKIYEKYQWVKKWGSENVCGDTMNSYARPVRLYLRLFGEKHYPDAIKGKKVIGEKYTFISDQAGRYKNQGSHWEAVILERGTPKEPLPKELIDYIKAVHTIGNFIPVPHGFNSHRGLGCSHDYWDLALLAIYDFYHHNCDTGAKFSLRWLLQGDQQSVANCSQWLSSFGEGKKGWNKFVEQNYLGPFLKNDMQLWEGHFNGAVDPSEENLISFFTRATECIVERGKLIVTELGVEELGKELPDLHLL